MGVTVLPSAFEYGAARPTAAVAAAASRPGVPTAVAVALADRALRQLARANPVALAELGDLRLPPIVGNADQDLLRLASPLYLASEMERAGLLDALDTTARLFASGGIRWDLGDAVGPLTRVWRERNRRFNSEERRAFFTRLFGAATGPTLAGARSNLDFERDLAMLAQALSTSTDPYQRGPVGGRVAASARRLAAGVTTHAAGVTTHAGGVPPLASRELLLAVKTALLVFGVPEVQRWLGARSVWSAVDSANRQYVPVGRDLPDVASHVRRGRAGVAMLAWLADALPTLRSSTAPPLVVDAAVEWLEATVALWERDRRHGA